MCIRDSALQRARATLKRHLPEQRLDWAPGTDPTRAERALLDRYLDATERADADAFVAMMREDARFFMPPQPGTWVGREAIVAAWTEGGFGSDEFGHLRGVVTRVNRQPAVACYVKRPGEAQHRAMAIDVLRVEGGAIADIVTFGPDSFAALGLPEVLR